MNISPLERLNLKNRTMNLTTTYLGLKLRTPLVPSASPLSQNSDNIKRMEDAGASAVVLHSLFEEQIRHERHELQHHLDQGTETYPEALSYFPEPEEFNVGPEAYLEHIAKAKASVNIPIIASLNGSTFGGWTKFRAADRAGRRRRPGVEPLQRADRPGAERRRYRDRLPDRCGLGESAADDSRGGEAQPVLHQFRPHAPRLDAWRQRARVVQSLLPAGHRTGIARSQPQSALQHADGDAPAAALDCHPVRPHRREPRRDQRHSSRHRCAQNAHGRRGRDDALLGAHAARHRAHPSHRARDVRMDRGARIRIGRTTQRQHEPEELPRPERLRARPIHARALELSVGEYLEETVEIGMARSVRSPEPPRLGSRFVVGRAQVDRSAYEPSLSNGRHHGIPPSIKSNEMR